MLEPAKALLVITFSILIVPQVLQANDDPAWLAACEDGGSTKLECLADRLKVLQADQDNDLSVLQTILDAPGPAGTDFGAARAGLTDIQKDWENFVEADCRLLDLVMGDFGGMGGEGLFCLIEHYEMRNIQIERWRARVE